jgi:pumilio RNA-binding family
VVQKLLDFGTQAQKDLLVVIIEQNVVSFSLQIYGCRVVQKVILRNKKSGQFSLTQRQIQAIEYTSPEQQIKIILELQPRILECIKNAHGTYVSDCCYTLSDGLNNHEIRSFRSSLKSYLRNA